MNVLSTGCVWLCMELLSSPSFASRSRTMNIQEDARIFYQTSPGISSCWKLLIPILFRWTFNCSDEAQKQKDFWQRKEGSYENKALLSIVSTGSQDNTKPFQSTEKKWNKQKKNQHVNLCQLILEICFSKNNKPATTL